MSDWGPDQILSWAKLRQGEILSDISPLPTETTISATHFYVSVCDLFHIFDIISCQPTRQIINRCQLSPTPILSLIFSPTRQSPFINLGKLWSQNYFSVIMNDRFSERYTTYLVESSLRNPLEIYNECLKKWIIFLSLCDEFGPSSCKG